MTNPVKAVYVDHLGLENIGTHTHDQIDNHIDDSDIHFADAPSNGQGYVRKDNQWVAAGSNLSLGDLNDVDLSTTTPSLGDLLEFDGTDWVPSQFLALQYRATGSQTLSAGSYNNITSLSNALSDTMSSGVWNASTGVFKPDVAGWYSMEYNFIATSATTGSDTFVRLYRTGTTDTGSMAFNVVDAIAGSIRVTGTFVSYFNGSDDQVQFQVNTASGTPTVSAATMFTAYLIRRT